MEVITNTTGIALIDTFWIHQKIADNSKNFPIITLVTTKYEGSSGFSIQEDVEPYVDIETIIYKLNSEADEDGNMKIITTITNKGNIDANNVVIRDTVSNISIKKVEITNGYGSLIDSNICFANIFSLKPRESVIYTTIGKALLTGEHKRRISAFASEPDVNIQNNVDTISLYIQSTKVRAPITIYPQDGTDNIDNPLVFLWHRVENVSYYHLQVSDGVFFSLNDKNLKDINLSNKMIVDDSLISDTTYTLRTLAGDYTEYFWRVRAVINGTNNENWSSSKSFITKETTDIDESTNNFSNNVIIFPNPIANHGFLKFRLDNESKVSITITNQLGNRVKSLLEV